MTQLEAWIVTLLGMSVVFIGLLLCVAFIVLFGRIAAKVSWGEHGHGVPAPAAPAPAVEAAPEAPPAPPVEPEVLAVIAAVLEVERKLYLSRPDSRLTIRRPVAVS